MEKQLKTSLLEYEKSTFLIDLIEYKPKLKYVKVTQVIEGISQTSEIKINPSILSDIILVLQNFNEDLQSEASEHKSEGYLSEDKQDAVISRYLKGINIDDLSLQFDCTKELITQVLLNKNIVIVSNDLPKKQKFYKKKRRR